MKKDPLQGTYRYDVEFFEKNHIPAVELKDENGKAAVLIIPSYQGRVMTSTASGPEGKSFGWINYRHIGSGKTSPQFNPYGGEERIWFGPEGGPFSIYFRKGDEQVFSNWIVPKEIDTEPFDIVDRSSSKISFSKSFSLTNYSGTTFSAGIRRNVRLLSLNEAEKILNIKIDTSLSFVAYESENILRNEGQDAWTTKSGSLSIWMLSMFNPSEEGVVLIPFVKGEKSRLGKILTDDYFGKVPAYRLVTGDGIIFFNVDGKHRSKIGLSPTRTIPVCGSYDPSSKTLTVLTFSFPGASSKYVNSKWGLQDDPFSGDVVNSYNDGPIEDGSVMGPFFEIESSSPAAFLKPGEEITHTQRLYHITGNEQELDVIVRKLFGVGTGDIKNAFR